MRQIRIEQTKVERTEDYANYLTSISHYPALTVEQEIDLAIAAQAGDKKAKDMLVNCNLRFVVSVAKQYNYCRGSLTILDLINEGNMGLIEAVDRFDVTRGFKFISFAVAYIRANILQAISKKSRIVTNYMEKDAPNTHTSLDAPCYDDSDNTLADVLCTTTDKESDASLLTDLLRSIYSVLTKNEAYVITNIYGIQTPRKAQWELAEEMHLTDERVRQLTQCALTKLRANDKAVQLLIKYM